MEPGRQQAEAWLADCGRAQREADRNAQQPAQLGAGEEIGGRARLAGSRELIAAQEGSGATRACACACPAAAERAMLDEIIALPDIEEQDGENVAMWVANALDALREERDAAIRKRDDFDQRLRVAKVKIGQLERAQKSEAWQPIETATRDKTPILVGTADGRRMIWRGDLYAGLERTVDVPGHLRFPGAWWMPLPEVPRG